MSSPAEQALVECLLATARINTALLHAAQIHAYQPPHSEGDIINQTHALQTAYVEIGALASRLRRAFPNSIA